MLTDQADQVVGVVAIDSSDDTAVARVWDIAGCEVAQVARKTSIGELVEILLRAQCTYVR